MNRYSSRCTGALAFLSFGRSFVLVDPVQFRASLAEFGKMFARTRLQLRGIQRFHELWLSRHEVAEMPKGEMHKLYFSFGGGRDRGADGRLWRRWTLLRSACDIAIENWSYPGDDDDGGNDENNGKDYGDRVGERRTISILWFFHLVEEKIYLQVYDAEHRPLWTPNKDRDTARNCKKRLEVEQYLE